MPALFKLYIYVHIEREKERGEGGRGVVVVCVGPPLPRNKFLAMPLEQNVSQEHTHSEYGESSDDSHKMTERFIKQ